MDDLQTLKLRIMALEGQQIKTNQLLATICKTLLTKKSQIDPEIVKAMEKFINNFDK